MRVDLVCHKNTLVVVRRLVKYSDAGVRDVAPKAFANIHVWFDTLPWRMGVALRREAVCRLVAAVKFRRQRRITQTSVHFTRRTM